MEGLGRVRGAAARRLWQVDAAGADFRLDPLAPKEIAFAGLGILFRSYGVTCWYMVGFLAGSEEACMDVADFAEWQRG